LADFKKCCSWACYQWLKVRMVLYCQEMFILQPNLDLITSFHCWSTSIFKDIEFKLNSVLFRINK
jgi:hypothetical protein